MYWATERLFTLEVAVLVGLSEERFKMTEWVISFKLERRKKIFASEV